MSRSKEKSAQGNGKLALAALLVLLVDQLTKSLVVETHLLPFLSFNKAHNTGAAFSIFEGYNLALALISVLVIALLVFNIDKFKTMLSRYSVAIIIGGALGNLIDRIIFGHVRDFISFGFFPTFNLADCAITTAIMILIAEEITS